MSVTVSSNVVGTPSAVPDADPMLLRMSLRTTSASVSTFGPLDPSPGYGPAVSSGIGSHDALVALVPDVLPASAVDAVVAVVPAVDVELELESDPHAASTAVAPAPASSASTLRRLSIRCRSTASPWSNGSSWSW